MKTVLQSVAISIYLLPLGELPGWTHVIAGIVMGLAVAMTVGTGADYVRQAVRLHGADPMRPRGPDER